MRKLLLVWSYVCSLAAMAQAEWGLSILDGMVLREQRSHRCELRSGAGVPGRGFDVTYHRLELALDPAVHEVAGTVTTYFTALEELSALRFDLAASLSVSEVVFHGSPITFTHTADSLVVPLPVMMAIGARDSIRITYAGVPDPSGFGSFVTDQHEGVPVQWTLSEPYGAKDWWPCKQDLADKVDSIDLFVTHPAVYRAAGNGLLVAEPTVNGNTTAHWRHRYPIAYYLIATAVTNYEVFEQSIDLGDVTVPMVTYTYPEHAMEAGWAAGDIAEQMPLFSTLFGTYPFADEKYGHAQFGWGGGMEHQTMSFLGVYHYEISAHELAHQWFGDKVTCGSWSDIWLNEGFATYLTGLCYENLVPQYWLGWKHGQVSSITSQPGGSVYCADTADVTRLFNGRLTYSKGAMVLNSLRWVCGDSAFFAGVRNYLADSELAFASARTADLQGHLEAASGLDLSGFMADWFTGEGYPTYGLAWSQDAGGNIDAVLHQTTSHPSVDFFELPVPVRFSGQGQDSTVVIDHTTDGQAFNFHLPFTVEQVVIDPEVWLISAGNTAASVPALGQDQGFHLFPNPADDQVWCALPQGLQVGSPLILADAAGRVVRELRTDGSALMRLDVGTLAPGAYVLRSLADDGVRTRMLIKR